jgi:branched-chain amino acid transport system ATP-binding protein
MTILLVEQNTRIALKISMRAYVMETGNIVLTGNTKDLVENEKVKQAYLGE